MSIVKSLEDFRIVFDNEMEKRLELLNDIPNNLLEAVRYSIFSGGKRIRPFLMMEVFKNYSKNYDELYDFAIALECIHSYSLVHDDLPSMDNDDYRRGKLTVHKKFGEDIAILVGDTLLNFAFEIISEKLLKAKSIDEASRLVLAFNELGKYSGSKGMIGGQVLDMEIHNNNDYNSILEMYKLKTAGLFSAATVIGAILSNANDEEVEQFRIFGDSLGIAYQIQDDILDMEEDLAIEKITIATNLGVEKANDLVNEFTKRAFENLEFLKEKSKNNITNLEELTNLLAGRQY